MQETSVQDMELTFLKLSLGKVIYNYVDVDMELSFLRLTLGKVIYDYVDVDMDMEPSFLRPYTPTFPPKNALIS